MGLDGDVPGWSVILPVKPLDSAKSRISGDRTDTQRLAIAFLEDAIAALLGSKSIADIVVVTSDPHIAHLSEQAGCRVVDDREAPGINAAVHLAALSCPPDHPVMVVVSDLPTLDPGTVDRITSLAGAHVRSFLPDADGRGTTIWCTTDPRSVQTAFGSDSAALHAASGAVDLAAAGGADLWRGRQDVDTREDLQRASTLGLGAHTRAVLAQAVEPVATTE